MQNLYIHTLTIYRIGIEAYCFIPSNAVVGVDWLMNTGDTEKVV